MKYILIILITATFIIVSCKQNTTDNYSEPKEVTITGTIKNFDKYPDFDVVNLNVFNIGLSKSETFYSKIDSSGNFKIKFPIYFPQDVSISHRTWFQFLVHPGDSINVNFDANIDNNVDIYNNLSFSGDASESNTQLAKYLKEFNANYLSYDDYFKYHKELATNEFVAFRDSIKKVMNERREKFIKDVNPTEEVKLWTYWNVEADYFNELLFHSFFYGDLNNLKQKDWDFNGEYYSFLNSLKNIDEKSLINTSVSYLLPDAYGLYLHGKFQQEVDSISLIKNYDSLLIQRIINLNFSNTFKELILSDFVNYTLEDQHIEIYEKNSDILKINLTSPYIIKPVSEHYNKAKEHLNNPETSSKAILDSIKTSDVSEIFNSILAKHKNKVLYIDCWATWCAPCRGEMPHSKKLIEKFAGKDIEFIFLCIDSEKDNWKAMLSELQIGGTHYCLTKAESSALRKILGISGIPHNVMVDKNGTIIKQGHDIRPSSGLAESEIQKLL
jgi:thiol-disulfide isomerase/thioredoxin